MKYAENNRISHRQLYHQIILSFLAPLLICIPGDITENRECLEQWASWLQF